MTYADCCITSPPSLVVVDVVVVVVRRHHRSSSSLSLFVVIVVRRHRCSLSLLFVVVIVRRRRHRSTLSSLLGLMFLFLAFPPSHLLSAPLRSAPQILPATQDPGSAGGRLMLRRPGAAGGTGDADEALPAMPAAAHVALLSACECLMRR